MTRLSVVGYTYYSEHRKYCKCVLCVCVCDMWKCSGVCYGRVCLVQRGWVEEKVCVCRSSLRFTKFEVNTVSVCLCV